MQLRYPRPVANGYRTDHPVPDLPFVDDAHIPLDDRRAIEAIGRHRDSDTWGREDRAPDGGWVAFTTDPLRTDLAWVVRFHPEHGRSVAVYRDDDASSAHTDLLGPALLYRAGGYWWDGCTWFRPGQVWDGASERYLRRPVPAATTVSAADLLQALRADPERATGVQITDLDPDNPNGTAGGAGGRAAGPWVDHLAWWAAQHDAAGQARHLAGCIVNITAPELTGDQLVGTNELAQIADVAPSTLRAYLARRQNQVPDPQAVVGGRPVWSRPVAQEWAEQRRSSEGLRGLVTTGDINGSPHPVGVTALFERMRAAFQRELWENPHTRKRWALRWRSREAVQEMADHLAWQVAGGVPQIVPVNDLAITVRHALLDELASGQRLDRDLEEDSGADDGVGFYGISSHVARTLDWLVRHDPDGAAYILRETVGEAERELGVPRPLTVRSVDTALGLDGKLPHPQLTKYLDEVFHAVLEGGALDDE